MDSKRLEDLYVRHRQGLFLLALSITRCPAASEDAVHEAFVRLSEGRGAPEGDGVAYVFSSVRNAAIDQVRRRRSEKENPASLYNGHAPSPEVSALAAERDRALRLAVDGLPLEQQEAVVLRVYADLSFEQIAEVCGAPLPTVFARYQRALEKLRDRLGSLK